MSLLESLRFTRGDTAIHNLDPRVKFMMTLVFLHVVPLAFVFLIQIPLVLKAKVFSEWSKSIKGAAFISGFIFVTNMVSFYYFRDGNLTWDLVEYSLSLTMRFIVLVTSFSIFFITTSPDKLSLALEKASGSCLSWRTRPRLSWTPRGAGDLSLTRVISSRGSGTISPSFSR